MKKNYQYRGLSGSSAGLVTAVMMMAAAVLPMAAATVTVNTGQTYQTIDGIGGDFTFFDRDDTTYGPVNDYMLDNFKPEHARVFWLSTLFEPSNDDSDPSNFNWSGFKDTGRLHDQFLFLQRCQNEGIRVVGCPWKMPSWLTLDSPKLHIPEAMYDEAIEMIAAYLVYAKNTYGVIIEYLSFNEPNNTGWDVYFSADQMAAFIKRAAPRFSALGLDVKWLAGDTYNAAGLVSYATPQLQDPDCLPYLGPISFHSYNSYDDGVFTAIADLAGQYGREVWVEEGGTSASNAPGDSWSSAFNIAKMYHRCLTFARASVIAHWAFSNYWAVVNPITLVPYPTYYVVKQLADNLPSGTVITSATSDDSYVWSLAGTHTGQDLCMVQLINTSSSTRSVDLTGLPNSTFTLTRTSQTESQQTIGSYTASAGGLSLSLPGYSISTLSGSLNGGTATLVVYDVSTSGITSNAAVVSWTTNLASSSQVEYGTTTAYGSVTAVDDALVTDHGVTVSGLTAGSVYHYRVLSRDAENTPAWSDDKTFTTAVTTPEGGNLALGRPVTASSTEGTDYDPAQAVDGDTATRWSSSFSDTEWIQVDLQGTYDVGTVVLNWEDAYGTSYRIEVSDDGSSWTTVYTTDSGSGGVEIIPISGTPGGRYVRLYGLLRGTRYGYSLWEFEIYGDPVTGIAAGSREPEGGMEVYHEGGNNACYLEKLVRNGVRVYDLASRRIYAGRAVGTGIYYIIGKDADAWRKVMVVE